MGRTGRTQPRSQAFVVVSTAFVLALGLPTGDAFAATTCSWEPSTATVSVSADPDAVLEIQAGAIVVDGVGCDPGATVQTVDAIVVTGTPDPNVVMFRLGGGPFAPGATEEPFSPEIEVEVSLGAGSNLVRVDGRARSDHFRFGVTGLNWNADEDVEDVDVQIADSSVSFWGNRGNDRIFVGAEYPHAVELRGGPGRDRLSGGAMGDVLGGGANPDLLMPGLGDDLVNGGGAIDTVEFVRGGPGVDVNLAAGSASGQGSDVLTGIERVLATRSADLLQGGPGRNLLASGAGDDVLRGGRGKDRLFGGPGDDVIEGGEGRDLLVGWDGMDRLNGGADADRLLGWSGPDRLLGAAGPDLLFGSRQDDLLRGGPGADLLDGGPGQDRCHQDLGRGPRGSCERPRPRILDVDTGLDLEEGHSSDLASTKRTVWIVEGEQFLTVDMSFYGVGENQFRWFVGTVAFDAGGDALPEATLSWWHVDSASTGSNPTVCRLQGEGPGIVEITPPRSMCTIPLWYLDPERTVRWRLAMRDPYGISDAFDFAPSRAGWFG